MVNTINNLSELISVMKNAKNGGQFATIVGESDVRLNKFPTDGSERIKIKDDFAPKSAFSVTYHFGANYDKSMAKALGTDTYTAHDGNRIHIVPNLIMEYISTGNTCLIYMPSEYTKRGWKVDGRDMTEEEVAYMKRYMPKPSASILEYRTLSVYNVREIHFGGEMYLVNIERITRKVV